MLCRFTSRRTSSLPATLVHVASPNMRAHIAALHSVSLQRAPFTFHRAATAINSTRSSTALQLPISRRLFSSARRDSFPKLVSASDEAELARIDEDGSSIDPTFKRELWKHIAFVLLCAGGLFAGAAALEWQRRHTAKITWAQIMSAHRRKLDDWRQLAALPPHDLLERIARMTGLDRPWSPGQGNVALIIGLHVLINSLFKLVARRPHVAHALEAQFLHFPPARMYQTYLTSMFAHRSVTHNLFNSFALWTFAPLMIDQLLGIEQFWAVYVAGGLFATLASTIGQTMRGRFHASLGASGAIYTLVGLLAVAHPHLQVNLFFLLPLELWQAVGAITVFDLFGLFVYKRFGLDHVAHLGGLAFGAFYALVGARWWRERDEIRAKLL